MVDNKEINTFIDYVLDFYGKGGIYDMKVTAEDVKKATGIYLQKYPNKWGGGDSSDREFVREILINEMGFVFPESKVKGANKIKSRKKDVTPQDFADEIFNNIMNYEWAYGSYLATGYKIIKGKIDKYGYTEENILNQQDSPIRWNVLISDIASNLELEYGKLDHATFELVRKDLWESFKQDYKWYAEKQHPENKTEGTNKMNKLNKIEAYDFTTNQDLEEGDYVKAGHSAGKISEIQRVQDVYGNEEEFNAFQETYGNDGLSWGGNEIMTVMIEDLDGGGTEAFVYEVKKVPHWPNVGETWVSVDGDYESESLNTVIIDKIEDRIYYKAKGETEIMSDWIGEFLQDYKFNETNEIKESNKMKIKSEEKKSWKELGASIWVEDDGFIKIHQPGWYSPELHPLAAYRLARDYYNTYEEFLKDINYDKTEPPLRTSGDNITDAFFILTGGRGGLENLTDNVLDSLEEEIKGEFLTQKQVDKIKNKFDEDDMIEYIWKYLELNTDKNKIKSLIDNKDSSYDIIEAGENYIYKLYPNKDKNENETNDLKENYKMENKLNEIKGYLEMGLNENNIIKIMAGEMDEINSIFNIIDMAIEDAKKRNVAGDYASLSACSSYLDVAKRNIAELQKLIDIKTQERGNMKREEIIKQEAPTPAPIPTPIKKQEEKEKEKDKVSETMLKQEEK
jgi:hypothetical protein